MRKIVLLACACFLAQLSFSQKKSSTTTHSSNEVDALYSKLKYRSIGPYRGGRSGALTGSYKNKTTFYMGSTGGGVWKTNDVGNNWENISLFNLINQLKRGLHNIDVPLSFA